MPDDAAYDPDAMRILEGMEPPRRRPAGHVHEPAHIVAIPAKRAAAVGQRVAELVAEALAAQDRTGEGTA